MGVESSRVEAGAWRGWSSGALEMLVDFGEGMGEMGSSPSSREAEEV